MSRGPAPVVIAPYDASWPAQFRALRAVLQGALGARGGAIHHVGSTAVPGLAAKPVLDVVIAMPTRDALPAVAAALSLLGYEHEGDKGIHEREAFRQRSKAVPRDGSSREWMQHHLYACAPGNEALREHLLFRDWLRGHPADATAYGALKLALAAQFGSDREGYTEAKSDFISGVLARVP